MAMMDLVFPTDTIDLCQGPCELTKAQQFLLKLWLEFVQSRAALFKRWPFSSLSMIIYDLLIEEQRLQALQLVLHI